ncbi:MAG: hypothetical protein MK085_01770 [Phycisphaerales bacterium]|nr:hypothetical protein [Phycisphaerales bacterium]
MAEQKVVICPYCGAAQTAGSRCGACGAGFDAETRLETQNRMGPWFIRDPDRLFQAGYSYEQMVATITAGAIGRYTVVRGPTTGQLWTVARKTPGLAHLLGDCHVCNAKVPDGATRCPDCHTVFGAWLDRNHLGLPEIHTLPGEPDGDDSEQSLEQVPLHEVAGFRPSTSEGISSFLHADQLDHKADESEPAETGEREQVESNSILDNAIRQELLAARRRASGLLVVTVLAILAAVATLVVALVMRSQDAPAGGSPADPVVGKSTGEPATPSTSTSTQGPANSAQEGSPQKDVTLPSRSEAEKAAIREQEASLALLVGRAADPQLDVEARTAAISEARKILDTLRAAPLDEAQGLRLDEHAEALDRAEQRLDF